MIEEMRQKLSNVMAEPFTLNEHSVPIAISVGISYYPCDGKSADTLLRCADQLMYQMKQKLKCEDGIGRRDRDNAYVLYSDCSWINYK